MAVAVLFPQTVGAQTAAEQESRITFQSDWPEYADRRWVGPDFQANRLQDWKIAIGRLECIQR